MIVDPADSSYMPSLVVVSGTCMLSEKPKNTFFVHSTAGIYLVLVSIFTYLSCIVSVSETNPVS